MQVHIAITSSGKIKAYSTSKTLVENYVNNMKPDKKKKVTIETVFLTKSERKDLKQLYGNKEIKEAEFLGDSITPDNEEVYKVAQEEHEKLKFIIKDLGALIDNYSLHKDDKKILKSAHALLKDLSKKKNFHKAIGFDTIREIEEDGKLHHLKRLFNLGGKRE